LWGLMIDDADDVERVALEMIKRFDDSAAHVARELAEIAAEMINLSSAEKWLNVAAAIERLSGKPSAS
jgi:hypothetical protein